MSVDTTKVQGRRTVKYASLREVLADAERLSRGHVKAIGNWSAGQIFLHLARSMDTSIDGSDARFPLFVRVLARLFKKKFLAGPMPPGYRFPASAAQSLDPGPTSTEDGLGALRSAIARQERESNRSPSTVFGELTRDEWTHSTSLIPLYT